MTDATSAPAVQSRIRAHRTADVTLTVKNPDGTPLANAPVRVRQTDNAFLFGCNVFRLNHCETPEQNAAYQRQFASLLNFATLPFYWNRYEPAPGQLDEARVRRTARWCRARGIVVKGHPLFWHQAGAPPWLWDKPLAEVEEIQLARIHREMTAYCGLVDVWDVVNEAIILPHEKWGENPLSRWCRQAGAVEVIRRCFAAARAANPAATLILNDFDVSPAYEHLIADCLDAGVPIDAIGIQSHMHGGYWTAEKAWEVCERFARFQLPLHFTELTILSGRRKTGGDWKTRRPNWKSTASGEKLQAKQAAELYRLLVSHPSVRAITWWDFSDQGAWMGAPSGLVRADMTPKPAYDALHQLIHTEWQTGPLKLTTDPRGRVRFEGSVGEYEVKAPQGRARFAVKEPAAVKVAARME